MHLETLFFEILSASSIAQACANFHMEWNSGLATPTVVFVDNNVQKCTSPVWGGPSGTDFQALDCTASSNADTTTVHIEVPATTSAVATITYGYKVDASVSTNFVFDAPAASTGTYSTALSELICTDTFVSGSITRVWPNGQTKTWAVTTCTKTTTTSAWQTWQVTTWTKEGLWC